MADLTPELIRRGYDSERRSAATTYRQALEGIRGTMRAVEEAAQAGKPAMANDLRRLVADATDAYQAAAAWRSLEAVAFMLPHETTKE